MKKQIIAVMLAAFIATGPLSAQENDSVTTLPTVTITSASGTVVNIQIDKAFRKTFPGAQKMTWYQMNKNYLVKFIENDMKHHVLFTKNGIIKYDISFGTEKDLPVNMHTKIRDSYNEYNITKVANIKQDGRNIWVINLENMKHIALVRLEEEEMEEVNKIVKN
jgi:hypothetical protein